MSSYPPSDPTATLGHFKSMIELSASTQTILQGIGMISADTHAQQIVENLKKLSDQLHEADLSTLPDINNITGEYAEEGGAQLLNGYTSFAAACGKLFNRLIEKHDILATFNFPDSDSTILSSLQAVDKNLNALAVLEFQDFIKPEHRAQWKKLSDQLSAIAKRTVQTYDSTA